MAGALPSNVDCVGGAAEPRGADRLRATPRRSRDGVSLHGRDRGRDPAPRRGRHDPRGGAQTADRMRHGALPGCPLLGPAGGGTLGDDGTHARQLRSSELPRAPRRTHGRAGRRAGGTRPTGEGREPSPPRPVRRNRDRGSKAAVAIVGGGIQGLMLAFCLAERGVRDIRVFDAGYWQGGASGRNGTLVRPAFSSPEWTGLFSHSQRLWRGLSRRLGHNVMYSQRGYIAMGESDRTAAVCEEVVRVARECGVPVRALSPRGAGRVPAHAGPRSSQGGGDVRRRRHRAPPRRHEGIARGLPGPGHRPELPDARDRHRPPGRSRRGALARRRRGSRRTVS